MSNPNLAPLSLGELLDQTFSHFRKHFWLFAGIMVTPQAVLVGLSILLQVSLSTFVPSPRAANPHSTGYMAVYGTSAVLGSLGMLIPYFLIYALALGATTYALSEIHLGRMTTIRESYRMVRKRFGPLINVIITILIRTVGLVFAVVFVPIALMGVLSTALPQAGLFIGVVVGSLVMLGLFVGGVLAMFFLLRYSVAVPALVLEDLSARKALRRSAALTKGALLRLMVVGFLMWIIKAVIIGLCQGPFLVASMILTIKGTVPGLWLTIPSVLAQGAAAAATAPLLMISFAIAYYDLRVRKEGFDLQLMMAKLDQIQPPGTLAQSALKDDEVLRDAGVFEMVLWTVLTAGLYQPAWFLRCRKALNALNSTEKLGAGPPVMVVMALGASIFLPLYGSIKWGSLVQAENAFGPLHPLLLFVASVIIIVLCFKVRRILMDHLAPLQPGTFSGSVRFQYEAMFSPLGTFFFGIFYLQHKINGLLDLSILYQVPQEKTEWPSAREIPVPPVAS
jgi:hypothetical protein